MKFNGSFLVLIRFSPTPKSENSNVVGLPVPVTFTHGPRKQKYKPEVFHTVQACEVYVKPKLDSCLLVRHKHSVNE